MIQIVSREMLEELAAEIPSEPAKPAANGHYSGNGQPYDLAAFIHRNGFEVDGPHPWEGGQKWTFDQSPMCEHHGDGPYVAQHGSGALMAGCHHDSCYWTWKELRAKFEPKGAGMPDLRPAEYRELPTAQVAQSLEILTQGQLCEKYPRLRRPVINGVARQGEIINIISYPKIGKSWLAYLLGLSEVAHIPWLGFETSGGRVLIVDNELHLETLAYRTNEVAVAMGLARDDYADKLDLLSLRGRLRSFPDLVSELVTTIKRGQYSIILFDSKYRFSSPGVSENDNAAETQFYNLADELGDHSDSVLGFIHHASKGNQSDKRVSDIGAGAGAQSRAADAHVVIREHEQEGVYVMEAAVRSFKPVEPIAIRWCFPLWHLDSSLDPSKLKRQASPSEQKKADRDKEAVDKIVAVLRNGEASTRILREQTGLSRDRIEPRLDWMHSEGHVTYTETTKRGNVCRVYRLEE